VILLVLLAGFGWLGYHLHRVEQRQLKLTDLAVRQNLKVEELARTVATLASQLGGYVTQVENIERGFSTMTTEIRKLEVERQTPKPKPVKVAIRSGFAPGKG
jgi:hypothetical protein